MRKKDKQTIIDATLAEINKQITDLRSKIKIMKIERFSKASKNVREIKNLRQKLAVILTILKEKELQHG
jgi:ribosomal protein L29